ncbi:hydrogenase maturation peptidase HycI [Vibrio marisflavi]|uniref:Hydrogenase 3 maturation protease n=1 Tax=Vibrio marisflavi CECT 7928 TaxID=634439 RepID=A0ABM9A755_9VIBR|nr:hydrogenase maturation peptidase HycI [Vibrio marisflavi]CAH0540493.1 Hydrogenase 3 maturation protease [Vibrio marisflavi CECT 7928]
MSGNILITVGNSMMGDDGAGPYLAKLCRENPVENWEVLEGGTMPEDTLHLVRDRQPQRVVVVDAADFGEKAGEIRIISSDVIDDMFMVSTHSLPLNFLIDELKTFVPEVTFVGIQPAAVAFSFPMTDMVKDAVNTIFSRLPNWKGDSEFEHC